MRRFLLSLLVLACLAAPVGAQSNRPVNIPRASLPVSLADANDFNVISNVISPQEIVQNRRELANAISADKYREGFVATVVTVIIWMHVF